MEPMITNPPTLTTTTPAKEHTNKLLDRFHRMELAAAQTYDDALKDADGAQLHTLLERNRQSHVSRAVMLSQRLSKRGADVSETAGAMGTVANLVEGGAAVFGDNILMHTLAEGERMLLQTYLAEMSGTDLPAYQALWEHVIGEQQECEARLRNFVGN